MNKRQALGNRNTEVSDDPEYKKYIDRMDDMLLDSDYDFASDTVQSIRDWAEEHGKITDGQKTAIDNIFNSKHRRRW